MKPLTKSLHTVTALSRVAKHLIDQHPGKLTPIKAVDRALAILGYDPNAFSSLDETILSAITNTRKLIS